MSCKRRYGVRVQRKPCENLRATDGLVGAPTGRTEEIVFENLIPIDHGDATRAEGRANALKEASSVNAGR